MISDEFEELARESLRKQGNSNPTKNKVATTIKDLFKPKFEIISKKIVVVN